MSARLLLYLGALLLTGGAGVRHLVRPVRLRWLGAGYGLLLLGVALNVGQTLAPLDALNVPDGLHYLLDISAGRAALWALLGATLLLASEVSRFSRLTTLGAAGLALWGLVGIGHGATHGEWLRLLHTLHAGAMSLWLAGVLALWRTPDEAAARRFSPWALGCLLVLGVTGTVMALNHAGNLLALPQSDYGRTLLLKVGLYLLTPLAALFVRRSLRGAGRVRLGLGLELLLLLGVLTLTASLTGLEPPGHLHSGGALGRGV